MELGGGGTFSSRHPLRNPLGPAPPTSVCLVLAIASIYFKNAFIGSHPSYEYYSNLIRTECRAVYLIAGLVLNLGIFRYWFLGCTTLAWVLIRVTMDVQVGKLDLVGFVFLVVVVDLTIRQKLRLRVKWLAWVGNSCFGIYLIHMPISLALQRIPFAEN